MALWLADNEMRHTKRFPNAVKLDRAPSVWLKTSFAAFVPDSHLSCTSARWWGCLPCSQKPSTFVLFYSRLIVANRPEVFLTEHGVKEKERAK